MNNEVTLEVTPKWPAWDKARTAVPNLTNGQLTIGGSPFGPDENFSYTISLKRKDGRKPTKAQVLWAETTIKAIEYVMGS